MVAPMVNQMDGCCATECTQNEKEQKQTTETCPFGLCCCNYCIACYPVPGSIEFTDVLTDSQKIHLVNEKPSSNYLSDSWHPPETNV